MKKQKSASDHDRIYLKTRREYSDVRIADYEVAGKEWNNISLDSDLDFDLDDSWANASLGMTLTGIFAGD